MTRRRLARSFLGTLAVLAAFALATVTPAMGATNAAMRVRDVKQDPDGVTHVVLSLTGAAAGQTFTRNSFTVTENATKLTADAVAPYSGSDTNPVAVAIAFDTSGSLSAASLADAKRAAAAFLDALPAQVRVGLVTFNGTAHLAVGFTTDRAELRRTINGVKAGGNTALYDAVTLAVRELKRVKAQPNVVVLSDGKDTSSTTTLDAARRAAHEAGAVITTVGLSSKSLDSGALTALASETGGTYLPVAKSSQLVTAFRRAATELSSQVALTYRSTDTSSSQLDISVALSWSGAVVSDSAVVLNMRTAGAAPPNANVNGPLRSFPAMLAGLVLLVLAMVLIFRVALAHAPSREREALQRTVSFYTERRAPESDEKSLSGATRGVRDFILGLVESLPKPQGYEAKVDTKLERAGWPLRASEFLAIRAGVFMVVAILVTMATGNLALGILVGVAGWFGPRYFLNRRIEKRSAAFGGQLADTLQLLAASVEAGYGLLQAVETIVREAPSPTSDEFSRTLADIRLGMPPHDALDAMADRVGGEDFRWVVMSMNIQREVGGNLVYVLRTVAETMRERAQLRRSVKVLSAEGKLSGYVLGGLPFALAAYIAVVNPGYLSTLFATFIGKLAVAFALGLMGVGTLWMRKIIRIEV